MVANINNCGPSHFKIPSHRNVTISFFNFTRRRVNSRGVLFKICLLTAFSPLLFWRSDSFGQALNPALMAVADAALAKLDATNLDDDWYFAMEVLEDDELRIIQTDGVNWLATFEQQEREQTAIPNLRVGFNRVFGYYVEVTKSYLNLVPQTYQRRQTLTHAERFVTEKLKRFEEKVLSATDRSKELEYEICNTSHLGMESEGAADFAAVSIM